MSRRQNPEDFLVPELEDLILHGGRHTLEPWDDGGGWEYEKPEYDDPLNSLGSPGSDNWSFVAMACRVLVNFTLRGYKPIQTAIVYFKASRLKWMGTERDSTIYAYMHGESAIGCALSSDAALRHEAIWWLKHWAARCLLFYSKRTGRVLTIGERSASAPPPGEKSWQDVFLATCMGWYAPPRHEKVIRHAEALLLEVGTELRAMVPPLTVLKSLGFRTMNVVRVAEWPEGKAVWAPGKAIDGNTQPIQAAAEQHGQEVFAPPERGYVDKGDRTHRKKGQPTLTEVNDAAGSRLLYESPVYGRTAIVLPPIARRTLFVEIGGPEIVKDLRSEATAPLPDSPPPGTIGSGLPPPAPPPAGSPVLEPPRRRRRSWWKRLLGVE